MKDLTKAPWGSYLELIHRCREIVHMQPLIIQAQTSPSHPFVERQQWLVIIFLIRSIHLLNLFFLMHIWSWNLSLYALKQYSLPHAELFLKSVALSLRNPGWAVYSRKSLASSTYKELWFNDPTVQNFLPQGHTRSLNHSMRMADGHLLSHYFTTRLVRDYSVLLNTLLHQMFPSWARIKWFWLVVQWGYGTHFLNIRNYTVEQSECLCPPPPNSLSYWASSLSRSLAVALSPRLSSVEDTLEELSLSMLDLPWQW